MTLEIAHSVLWGGLAEDEAMQMLTSVFGVGWL